MIRTLIAIALAATFATQALAQTPAPTPSPDSNQLGELRAQLKEAQDELAILRRNAAGEAALSQCTGSVDKGVCHLEVIMAHPGTPAAHKAKDLITELLIKQAAPKVSILPQQDPVLSVPTSKVDRLPLPPVVQGMPSGTPPTRPQQDYEYDFGTPNYQTMPCGTSPHSCSQPRRSMCDQGFAPGYDPRPMPAPRFTPPVRSHQGHKKPRCNRCR